ncbi:hypothetical protein RJ639_007655 [Escallonia herrerae]|uniref:Uncharacterized protein n=1 Tax=Escallonia herrerae TaxID=1293975 RepID=A0AA88VYF5_9ASTE|nr:hypothetical protein RJ639_007655 [Escallonia herrerae]
MRKAVGQLFPTKLRSNVVSSHPLQLQHHHDKRLRARRALMMVYKPCSADPAFEFSSSHGGEDLILLMEATGGRESSQVGGIQGGLGEDCGASPPKKGYLAVYVGKERMRRFVIPASYLSLPEFRALMDGWLTNSDTNITINKKAAGDWGFPYVKKMTFRIY